MSKTAAIIFIGTNKYADFFTGFYDAVSENFCPDLHKKFFVFTDRPDSDVFKREMVHVSEIEHLDWPYITLYRFKCMVSIKQELEKFDYTFFVDADLWPSSKIGFEELFPPSEDNLFVGVQHPGFFNRIGTFETNTDSHAGVLGEKYDLTHYRQGCFWGGTSEKIIEMVCELDSNVDDDLNRGIIATWHDESHMNKFFLKNNEHVRTLNPGFATPQEGYEDIKQMFETRMVHLHKDINEFPRFAGARSHR